LAGDLRREMPKHKPKKKKAKAPILMKAIYLQMVRKMKLSKKTFK
jgi:hypothetical protein